MGNRYLKALFTSALSILPILIIVLILSISNLAPIGDTFTISGLGTDNYILLAVGGVIMIIGLSLFSVGAGQGLAKVGEYMGASLSKQKSIWVIILFAFLLGALITCAEPSILIVSEQININKWLLIGSIAVGVGIFVVIGILRIVHQKSLKVWYLLFYLIVFLLICLLQADPKNAPFLPFIFDAGGVTTGSATVPFILALGAGVASVRGGKNSTDSSFGLVGMASIGPILTMTILILVSPSGFQPYDVPVISSDPVVQQFLSTFIPHGTSLGTIIEVVMALAPIIVIFFIYELIYIKLPKNQIGRLFIGFGTCFVGLTLFLSAVSAAMSPIGLTVGKQLAAQQDWVIILIAFVIGLVTILCEPAVHVLTNQIEVISDGQLKKRTVLIALSIGVGVAIMLSVIRTMYKFSIMYYMVPGYLISLLLMFCVPDIYTSIAFDSGGTASGPMAVSFVLPLIIGLYSVRNSNLDHDVSFYNDAFGVVAMIALTPIIAIQVLGLVTKFKEMRAFQALRASTYDARNNEIIHFN